MTNAQEGPIAEPVAEPVLMVQPVSSWTGRFGFLANDWRAGLAALAMLLTPVLAYVGNLGLAALVGLLGIGALPLLVRRRRPISWPMLALTGLLVWALVSMIWSPVVPLHADFHRYKSVEALTAAKLCFELALYGAFVAAMMDAPADAADAAGLILAYGLLVLAALLMLEAFGGATLYQWIKAASHQRTRPDLAERNVARGVYVAVVLVWPALVHLARRAHGGVMAALIGVLCLAALRFRVDSPLLALAVAAVVFGLVWRFGRPVVLTMMGAVMIYFLAAPLAARALMFVHTGTPTDGAIAKASWSVRLGIWRFVGARITENPLRGYGLDASRAWPLDIPLHPHDAALQLWLEVGAPGVLLAMLFWALLLRRVAGMARLDRTMAAACAASATAFLLISALSFGVWQEWWLAVGSLAVAACTLELHARQRDGVRSQGAELVELTPID